MSSSPAAAKKALTTRLQGTLADPETLADDDRLHDGTDDDLGSDDLEPAAAIDDAETLKHLIQEADKLAGKKGDPKLAKLIEHLDELMALNCRPVVFCRYIATAHYVAEHVRKHFKDATVEAITGEYTPEERELRVETLGEADKPILVATDCLSEGVNLQNHFDAMVHYDLAWNPTRHEQREGRVDRFGQQKPEVYCAMLYGQDNPVDGFILNVILKKANKIKQELGVLVPMPDDSARIDQALIKAALMKRKKEKHQKQQLELFPGFEQTKAYIEDLETRWEDALEKAKANRTVFAQRRLKPEDVLPEWRKQCAVLGGEEDVKRFVQNACARLGAPLEPFKRHGFKLLPKNLPPALRERFERENMDKPMSIDFSYPPLAGTRFVHRSDPLVRLLADTLLESALTPGGSPLAARCAVTVTADVDIVTTVYLLRLRLQLTVTGRRQPKTLMAEETAVLSVKGRVNPVWSEDLFETGLLHVKPSANLHQALVAREIHEAMTFLEKNRDRLETLAHARAENLLSDHRRIREAAKDVGTYKVSPCLPVDVMGVYVLLPDSL